VKDVNPHDSELDLGKVAGKGLQRRDFLKFTIAAGFAAPLAGTLAGCATGGGGTGGASGAAPAPGGAKSDKNPFGIDEKAAVDIVIFKGGFSDQYAIDAGAAYNKAWGGQTAKVTSTTKINTELQPRFVGGNPPGAIVKTCG